MKNKILWVAIVFSLLFSSSYAQDLQAGAISDQSQIASKEIFDSLIKESQTFQTEKKLISDNSGIETNINNLKPPYPSNQCDNIDKNTIYGKPAYWLCVETLYIMNKATVSINQNTNDSLVKTIKELTYNMLYATTKIIYSVKDDFIDIHKSYLTQVRDFYANYPEPKTPDDPLNPASFDGKIKAGIENSLIESTTATAETKAALVLKLNTTTPDPHEFIDVPVYTAKTLSNADLIKNLLLYYPPLPKEISLLPIKYRGSDQLYLRLKNFKKTPAVSQDFPIDTKDLKQFRDQFTSLPEFQDYQVQRSSIILSRLLYFSSILRSYYARQDNNSIANVEYNMALEPLKPKYYDKIAKEPLASLAVEVLRSLNNGVYFLYQLHRDNERVIFMQAMSGLLMGSFSDMVLSNKADDVLKKMVNYYCLQNKYNSDTSLCPRD